VKVFSVNSTVAGLKRLALVGVVPLLVNLFVLPAPMPTLAQEVAQHQQANIYTNWDFGGATGFWNIDQLVQISHKAPSSFWAMFWGFTSTPNEGGYMGLQANGHRFDGSQGDTAIFSLWGANGVRGPGCGTFTGEGQGYSCRVAYTIDSQAYYRYRVWRMEADVDGQWWGAWIQDQTTGTDTYLGSIRVASHKILMTPPGNLSEYFGPAVPCDDVPMSTVIVTQPAANQLSPGYYEHGSTYNNVSRASCTGGAARLIDFGWTRAANVTLGGPR